MSQYRDITIEQGESWELYLYVTDIQGRPIDLSDSTVSMKMKKSYTAIASIPFHAEVIDAIKGHLRIYLDESETIQIKALRYVYDCIIHANQSGDDPTVIRFLEGIVTVTPTAQ
jgi:hypothetical protein